MTAFFVNRIKKRVFVMLLLVCITAGFTVPFPSTVSPQIEITVVDQSGAPIPNIAISREYVSIWSYGKDAVVKTDAKGMCIFPEHVSRLSLFDRSATIVGAFAPVHGSGWQPRLTDVDIDAPGLQLSETKVLSNDPNPSFYDEPGRVVLRVQYEKSKIVRYQLILHREG